MKNDILVIVYITRNTFKKSCVNCFLKFMKYIEFAKWLHSVNIRSANCVTVKYFSLLAEPYYLHLFFTNKK